MKLETQRKIQRMKNRLIWMGVGWSLLVFVTVFFDVRQALANRPVTDDCPICTLTKNDGLILVDIQTGRKCCLDIWIPHETQVGKVAPWSDQLKKGEFLSVCFIGSDFCFLDNHIGGVEVYFTPEDEGTVAYLCETHNPLALSDYVLVDSRQEPHIVYPIVDCAKYEIRHYTVDITLAEDKFQINIESDLFADELQMWEMERNA